MKAYKTLVDFINHFKDEETCRKHFEQIRFANGDYCPHCKHDKIMRFSDGKRYRCQKCKQDFTIKTGTLFGESKISMQKWFIAIYLLTSAKKGVSSIDLASKVGVSQKTAWFMDHRIREAMKQGRGLLSGTFEIDETYTGGKEKNKHLNKRVEGSQGGTNKMALVGIFQRGGEVRTAITPKVYGKPVEYFIASTIKKGSTIYTDDARIYKGLKKSYVHDFTRHNRGEYVKGDVHSNTAESFWALFKRGYHGTYHSMSPKHLRRYVNEFSYRYNRRSMSFEELFGDIVSLISNHGKMSYKTLTA